MPQIKEIILTGIKKVWQGNYSQVTNQEVSFTPERTTKRALEDKNKIGWSNFSSEGGLHSNGRQRSKNTTPTNF
jgi:hypothetical protein